MLTGLDQGSLCLTSSCWGSLRKDCGRFFYFFTGWKSEGFGWIGYVGSFIVKVFLGFLNWGFCLCRIKWLKVRWYLCKKVSNTLAKLTNGLILLGSSVDLLIRNFTILKFWCDWLLIILSNIIFYKLFRFLIDWPSINQFSTFFNCWLRIVKLSFQC